MKVKIKRVRGGSTGDQRDYGLTTGSIWNYEDKPINNNLAATISAVPRDEANIEAERGETVVGDLDADGNLEHAKIGGKRHFEGGTPLNVPDGSFIFSDTSALKIKNKELLKNIFGITSSKSITPADVAKKYELNKYKDMLQDPNVDPMTKKTAQMMIDNNLKKLGQLALIQEGMKGFPDGIPDIAMPLFGSDMGQGMGGGEQGEMGMARYGGLQKAQPGKQIGKAASFNTTGNYTAEQAQRAQAIAKAAEEKKKAEIAANQAASRKMYRDAQIAKKIQTQNLQDISGFTNKEGHDSDYLFMMNRFAKFRDKYIREMQDAIKYNRPFVMSDDLQREAKDIQLEVRGDNTTPARDVKGSATFISWRHPMDAWNQFSIAGGTDQGQVDDMADVVQNMTENPDNFMKQTFPNAYKEQIQKKAEKQYNIYNNNAKIFSNELQKVISAHEKAILEKGESPYDQSAIQKAQALLLQIKNLPKQQAKKFHNDISDGKSAPLSDEELLRSWDLTRKSDADFGTKQVKELNKLIESSGLQGVNKDGQWVLNQSLFPRQTTTTTTTGQGANDFTNAEQTTIKANEDATKKDSTTVVVDPNSSTKEEKKKKTPVNTGTKTNTGTTNKSSDNIEYSDQEVLAYGGLIKAQNGKTIFDLEDATLKALADKANAEWIRPTYFPTNIRSVGNQSPGANPGSYKRLPSGEIVPVAGIKNKKTGVGYNSIDDFVNYASQYLDFKSYGNSTDATEGIKKWKADLADKTKRKNAGEWFAKSVNAYNKSILGADAPDTINLNNPTFWEMGLENLNVPFARKKTEQPKKEGDKKEEEKTKTEMGDMPDVVYQQGYEKSPWFRQDLANYYNAIQNAARVDKGAPPIMQSAYSPLVDATFLDPAQQIAALQGNLNTTQAAIRASQDGPNAVANLIAASASSAPNIANVIADYDNKNVGIANQVGQLNNQIITRDLGLNRDYVKRFYDENVVREQQYENAVADAANEVTKAYMQGETNRDAATSANVQNPNYSFDPLSGRYYFKRGYDPRTGAPIDGQASPGELFKYYTEQYNLTPDQAIELITGTRAKSKTAYGDENTAQYGGYTYNPIDVIWNY